VTIAHHPPEASAELLAALRRLGYDTTPVGELAALMEDDDWSLLVVELGDDPTSGLGFARRVKEATTIPVLMVAGRDHAPALADASCDDLMLSPIDPIELALRVGRLVSTVGAALPDEIVTFKDLSLNLATYQATIAGVPIDLTFMEYELLRFFVTNSLRVWSREQLATTTSGVPARWTFT
jgi:DNA-binding response OmpR family regulator